MAFAIYFSFRDVPATTLTLICFAEFLLRSFTAAKSVTNALSSVRRLHRELRADTAAFDSDLQNRWRRALPLTFRNPELRAPPLPLSLLNRLCRAAATLGRAGEVFAALLAVCFFTMARLSSLVPQVASRFDSSRLPTLGDLRAVQNGYHINLKWSKTAQSLQGHNWVPLLPWPGSHACPVAALHRLRAGHPAGDSHTPLFSFPLPSGTRGRTSGGFTLSLARKWLRTLLCTLGESRARYSFHSLRRGACTLAFRGGCARSDIQLHGGWRSDAVNLYFSDLDARLRVAGTLANSNPN